MQVSHVRNEEAAAAAAKSAGPEEFEGRSVVDGKVVRTYGDVLWRTDIAPIQDRYEASIAPKQAEDESYSWNPLVWIFDMFSAVFSAVGDGVKNVLSICGYGASEKADAAEGTEKAEGEKAEQA
jgi:hypothetical protein